MTENQRYKVNFASKGGSFNADQFVPRLTTSYYNEEAPLGDIFVTTNYKEKENKLSFELLEKVALEVAPISNIISTRIDQVGAFTSRSRYATDGVGFKVVLKDSNEDPTEEQEKTIDLIEKFIENCGLGKDSKRDDFGTFIKKIIRDSLTYDQVNFELEYDVTGQYIQAFEAVDAATIKPALEDTDLKESAYDDVDVREGEELSYVQVIDGKIVAGFTADEMAFAVRNPRTNVKTQPYGLSEIETIVRQLTSYLEAEDYNMRFFQQGGMTKGILNIKGEKNGPAPGDRQTLESFKRQWRTQVTGQKGAWKIPVFTLPGELEFINIAQSGGEMVFEKWVNYLINIICGAYKIDPAEINFPNNGGVGGKGSSLFSDDGEKVDNSKQKGLFPLLKFIENTINKNIIEKFNTEDEYKFVFDGIDNESESEQVDLAKKKTESYMTINEVRAEKGLPEIKGGDIIANAYYVQAKQMAPGGDSMDFDFDSYGDDEEGGDDTEIEDEETSEDLFQKSLRQVNKEIEKENILEKKLDRSKLVLMETQVNDKSGTHTAKRWKNPSAALKELKRQMKLPKSATLTFTSKANKEKKLTEKQFKNHLRKVKPNITLQQYIKNSFIVKVTNNNGFKNKSTKKLEKIVSKLIDKAKHHDKQVTNDLINFTSNTSGSLEGLDYRIKSVESTTRKIKDKSQINKTSPEEYSKQVTDILRYTFCSNENNLVEEFFDIKNNLENKGYNIIEINNTFSIPNTTYKGINTLVKNSDGYIFELQFHTYQSLKIKEENHKLYEKARLSSTPSEEVERLTDIMIDNSIKIKNPVNIDDIVDLIKE